MAFDLLQNEKIILVRRRHWFKLLESVGGLIFGLLIVLAVPFFIAIAYGDIFRNFTNEIFLGAGLMAQLFLVALFLVIIDYHLDVWIITNERLVFIELKGLFNRKVSSVHFRNVQDVSVEVKGVLPTLLNYGNLQVQTAGEFNEFIFKDVPHPYELKDKILSLQNEGSNQDR